MFPGVGGSPQKVKKEGPRRWFLDLFDPSHIIVAIAPTSQKWWILEVLGGWSWDVPGGRKVGSRTVVRGQGSWGVVLGGSGRSWGGQELKKWPEVGDFSAVSGGPGGRPGGRSGTSWRRKSGFFERFSAVSGRPGSQKVAGFG